MDSSYPLINTKIRTPQRRQYLLQRGRLLDFVHSNIHHKLILIGAGAGYGKTSLLIDYAHDTDLPVCWYSLDSHDADVLTFLEYLVASIRQRFPQFGEPILQALRARSTPPEAVEPFVRLLIHEIETCIQQYFVIVLDDYHEVIDSEPVNALIDGLLRYLPEHCHVVLASRGIPRRLTLTRLAARQEVVGLGVEHLRFTPEEVGALLEGMAGRGLQCPALTQEQIVTLAERSEGWITGILLAAQSNWMGAAQEILQLTGASGGVFDYMAEEIFERQPPEKQQFLLGSALFREQSPPLCNALLEISNSAQLLQELCEQNLFTFPLDAEGGWYQYHQLFREFLVAKFERDEPQRYRALCLKQAQILAHRGRWDRAVESYITAHAYDQAADALEIVAQESFDSGQWDALTSWTDALPHSELAKHPRLLLFRAKVHTDVGELNQAAGLLDEAYSGYVARGDTLGAARVLLQTAVVLRSRGRLNEAIDTCRRALVMSDGRDSIATVWSHRTIGTCHAMLGQFDEGIQEMQLALRVAEVEADDVNAAHLCHDIGSLELQRGRLSEARKRYHRALMYWRKVGNASALALTLQDLGILHHHLGQYVEAESRFQEALGRAQALKSARIHAYTAASYADLLRDTGRYEEALAQYRHSLQSAAEAQESNLTVYILDAMADTHRLKGDTALAKQALTEAMDQIRQQDMSYESGLCHLSAGALALQAAELAEAETHLNAALASFAQGGAKRDLARTSLHLARLTCAAGRMQEATTHLRAVADLAKELGTYQFVVAEGPDVLPLIQQGAGLGVPELDHLRIRSELEQLFPSFSAPVQVVAAIDEQPIELLGLNGGQIVKDGAAVTDWESPAARVMAFLFALHPEGLRRDRVIDMLWPEVSPAKGNSLFHSSLYRLRSALVKDLIVYENAVYRPNSRVPCRFDVAEFQDLAQRGRANGGVSSEEAHQARVRAIELYRTPFLEACDEQWCQEMRESLVDLLRQTLLDEAEYLIEAGMLREAETRYVRVLGIDPYEESAHRGIMRCRAMRDDRSGALRQYRECARILRLELDIAPDEETTSLYERIVSCTPLLEL